MTLQSNLLEYCKKKNLTLAKLARLSEVPQSTLHGWSTGRKVQDLNQLRNVCRVLETGLYELLFDVPDPFSSKLTSIDDVFTGDVQITIHKVTKKDRPP